LTVIFLPSAGTLICWYIDVSGTGKEGEISD
jgi:hypothetical protein